MQTKLCFDDRGDDLGQSVTDRWSICKDICPECFWVFHMDVAQAEHEIPIPEFLS